MALGVSNIGFRADADAGGGGSFLIGGSGIDRSNDVSAILTVADGVTDGVSTTLHSDAGGFSANSITDNTAFLDTGSGEYVRIVSVDSDNDVTMDRIIAADTNIVVNVGGAFDSLDQTKATLFPTGANKIKVKSGTYAIPENLSPTWGGSNQGLAVMEGYKDTPDDGQASGTDAPLFALGVYKWTTDSWIKEKDIRMTSSNDTVLQLAGNVGIQNIKLDYTGTSASAIVCRPGNFCQLTGCEFTATNTTSAGVWAINIVANDTNINACYIHDMGTLGNGITLTDSSEVTNTIFDGLNIAAWVAEPYPVINSNTFYDNAKAIAFASSKSVRSIGRNIFNSNTEAIASTTWTSFLIDNDFTLNDIDIVSAIVEKSTGATADLTGFVNVLDGNLTPIGLTQDEKFYSFTNRGAVQEKIVVGGAVPTSRAYMQ